MTTPGRWLPASLRERSLKRNVVLNWTAAIVGAATSLAITPLVVGALDTVNYGVWTFLNGLTLYSNLLYLGLGTAFLKGMSESVGRDDAAAQVRLLGVAVTLYACIGAVCLLAAAALSPVVPRLLATPLPAESLRSATIAMALLGVRLLIMFVNSAFSALLSSHGRWDMVSGILIVATLARAAGTVVVTRLPDAMEWLALLMVLDAVVQLPALVLCCRAVAPEVKIRPAVPNRAELATLYGFGLQAFIVQIAALVIGYTDTALIGVLLGAASVTLYVLPLQLIEHSRALIGGITQSLLPELAALRARGDTAGLRALYFSAARACAALSVFFNLHLVLLGPAFLRLWVGPAIAAESGPILLCLAVTATSSALSAQVLTPYYQALDRLRVLAFIVVAEAVVNFGLSVWLSGLLGVWGVALASAVPAVGITLLWAPWHILPRIDVSFRALAADVLAPAAALGTVCLVVQVLLSSWLSTDSYLVLALRMGIVAPLALLVVAATFPRSDWLPLVARLAPGFARRLA